MKKVLLILLLSFYTFGCDESILEIAPQDQISAETTWNDPELIELYVNGLYNLLPHGFIKWAGGLRLSGITDESLIFGQNSLLNKYVNGGLTASNLHLFGSLWRDAYNGIYNCSLFIENVNEDVGDPDRIAHLTAEVRFLRAWFYIELISRYGDVPLLRETLKLEDDLLIERSSVEEVIAFVTEELDSAIPNLKENHSGNDFGRVTKAAAIGLKIRALMYDASPLFNSSQDMSKWQKVADACEDLFAINNQLSDDYQGMFLNPSDPEIMFFKQFRKDAVYDFNTSNGIDYFRYPSGFGGQLGWAGEHPNQVLIDAYETLEGEIPVLGYSGQSDNLTPIFNPAATTYDPDDPYQNRDPRLSYTILYDGAFFSGREVEFFEGGKDSADPPDGNNANNTSTTGYGVRKNLDESWTLDSGESSDQPWVYMRLAEFFLTYAEAQYYLGNPLVAEEYVDKVRSRVGVEMPPIANSLTGMDLLSKIKHERQIELAFETNRWYDSKRWKDAVRNFSQDIIGVEITKDEFTGERSFRFYTQHEREFPEYQQFWPIPFSEITKTNLQQNPGY